MYTSKRWLKKVAGLAMLGALACEASAGAARGGEGYARKILGAKSKDEKEQAAVKGRKGTIEAREVMTILRRERSDSLAALVVGMYLEKGDDEGTKTAEVVKAFASRKGQHGKAAVMAACSPHMEKIVKRLAASRSPASRVLAATIVAVRACTDSLDRGRKGKGRGAGKKRGGQGGARLANVDLEPMVERLLSDRSKGVQELAVLAAAYAEVEGVGDAIAKLSTAGAPGLAGARLLYLARTGQVLPEELTHKALRARVAVPKRYTRLSPLLHSYSLRGHVVLYACQAVAAAGDGRLVDTVHALLGHKDLRVQLEAARAIEQIGADKSAPVLLKKLASRSPWPVKVSVLSALGAIPAKESVEPLLQLMETELGRLRQDAAYALASICPPLHKLHPTDWRRWWDENGDRFQTDREATRKFREAVRVQDIPVEALAEFYGGKILSNRVVFVLDTSLSMKGEQIKELRQNMAATLASLPKHVRFNVVNFGGIVHVMKSGALIPASERSHAKQLVDYMELTYGTRSFDAMEAAERLPGMDTLFYLSDGMPVAGQFEAWPRIVRAFDVYNRYRPVSMNCILYALGGKGGKAKGKGKAQARGKAGGMQKLADHNAGLMTIAGQGGGR